MGVRSLLLSELRALSAEQRAARIAEFAGDSNAPLNGELTELSSRISDFERRYEMSSETMRSKLDRGELKETAEIGRWSMLVDLRNDLERAAS
ncbi:MAG TPA: hypothetical protein PK867_09665 [Pirellulales bacterium]|nr:hypothetical protein [Pirellulales bacterium]